MIEVRNEINVRVNSRRVFRKCGATDENEKEKTNTDWTARLDEQSVTFSMPIKKTSKRKFRLVNVACDRATTRGQ